MSAVIHFFKKKFGRHLAVMTLSSALIITTIPATIAVSEAAEAEVTFVHDNITYLITSEDNATVSIKDGTSFTGSNLPDTVSYDGKAYRVTSIQLNAFQNCTDLNLTSLPEGITKIGSKAFQNCKSLNLTYLPENLASIGISAFYGCTSLALTSLPEKITELSSNVFNGCTNLALTSLPESLTSVNAKAFYNCTKLGLTKLPDTTKYIGESAFYGCTELTMTSLPAPLYYIGSSAFGGCTSLALTSLPEHLEYLGSYAFSGCSKLAITQIPTGLNSNEKYFSSSTIQYQNHIMENTFQNCTSLTQLEIPESIVSIDFNAFRGCLNLTTLSLPDSLLVLDSQCLSNCPNLELTSLPQGLTECGYQAFYGSEKITYLVLGDHITSFSYQTFSSSVDLIISDTNTATYQTLQTTTSTKPLSGTITYAWDGTQSGLTTSQNSYITGSKTISDDLILENGHSLVIADGGVMTIIGNLTIENGAEVTIANGGTLIVQGTILNNGIITNLGTITNNGAIQNNNIIQSSGGTLNGNEIAGNAALTMEITVTPYSGIFDNGVHPCIININGVKSTDSISYSTNYDKYHIKNPELIEWSSTCPEYRTVDDTDNLVTVRITRQTNGEDKVIALVTCKIIIQRANVEIVELPTASAITEGDFLNQSILSGGQVKIKGTDIILQTGSFFWGSDDRDKIPALADSNKTAYSIYFSNSDLSRSIDTVIQKVTVTVNPCLHEGTGREYEDPIASTCTICKATKTESIAALSSNPTPGTPSNPTASAKPIDPTGSSKNPTDGTPSNDNTGNNNTNHSTKSNSQSGKGKQAATLKKGMIIKDKKSNGIYKITSISRTSGTVTYQRPLKKKAAATISKTIRYQKRKFRITAIASNAMKNNARLKNLTIEKNIRKIGKRAFSGCKHLCRIRIKTTKLTAKSIGSGAFSKVGEKSKKCKIIVPKKKITLYKKILRKRGLKRKVKLVK